MIIFVQIVKVILMPTDPKKKKATRIAGENTTKRAVTTRSSVYGARKEPIN